jgi:hypothetical protein
MLETTKHTAAALVLLGLMPAAATAQAPETPVDLPDRIGLTCTEQPAKRVAFGDDGTVDYREVPPAETAPVTVTITRLDAGAGYAVDAARIDSSAPYLAVEKATWTAGHQVDANQGQLRINLDNNIVTLTETGADGQAAFRRFECERLSAGE